MFKFISIHFIFIAIKYGKLFKYTYIKTKDIKRSNKPNYFKIISLVIYLYYTLVMHNYFSLM